jgi:hypothetical protein
MAIIEDGPHPPHGIRNEEEKEAFVGVEAPRLKDTGRMRKDWLFLAKHGKAINWPS